MNIVLIESNIQDPQGGRRGEGLQEELFAIGESHTRPPRAGDGEKTCRMKIVLSESHIQDPKSGRRGEGLCDEHCAAVESYPRPWKRIGVTQD